MPSLREFIDAFEARRAADPSRPVRIVRVAMLPTTSWRQDVRITQRSDHQVLFPSSGNSVVFQSLEARRCAALAETGEHLGLARVGRVVS